MGAFQWDKYHVDMLVERFKNSSEEIDARTIQQEFRSFQRRKGIQKLYAQDFRNLMRFIVWHKLARVTQGCFTSNNYRIRMVSDQYLYIQELFDKELFDNPLMREPIPEPSIFFNMYFPNIDKSEWNSYFQESRDTWSVMTRVYTEAFLIHNFYGGDYDRLLKVEGVLFDKKTREARNDLCVVIKNYTCQYQAFKLAEDDLKLVFNKRSAIPVDLGEKISYLVTEAKDFNSLFAEAFQASILLHLLASIKGRLQPCKKPGSTYWRRKKEMIKDFKEEAIFPPGEMSDFSQEYINLVLTRNFWLCLPFISQKEEVLEAYKQCRQSFIDEAQTFPHLVLTPVKQENKPPTGIA